MGDVAHCRGSNIVDRQLRRALTRRTSPKIAIETMFTSSPFFFMVSNVQLLKSRHHGVEIGPQVFWQLIVPGSLASAGVHGFQGTVTLGSRRKFFLFFVLEFVLSMRAFLTTIACDERVMLELGAQAVWQFPTSQKKSSWLCTCPGRSLTNFSRVGRSAVILDFPARHRFPSFECLLPTGA